MSVVICLRELFWESLSRDTLRMLMLTLYKLQDMKHLSTYNEEDTM